MKKGGNTETRREVIKNTAVHHLLTNAHPVPLPAAIGPSWQPPPPSLYTIYSIL